MTPHSHAEILRAIAEGKTIQRDINRNNRNPDWIPETHFRALHYIADQKDDWAPEYLRVKPAMITVNGIEVPEPLKNCVRSDLVYRVSPGMASFRTLVRFDPHSENHVLWLKRGILHATSEAAVLHSRAMLGLTLEACPPPPVYEYVLPDGYRYANRENRPYNAMRKAGWTDQQLLAYGHLQPL